MRDFATVLIGLMLLLSGGMMAQTPAFRWAASQSGTSADATVGVAVDAAGNSYVTGYFYSSLLTIGPISMGNAGNVDMFIAKYDAGGKVVWAKSVGGPQYEVSTGIAVDAAGNSYVTGYFSSPSITFGSTTLTNTGGNDIFVAKYDPNGIFLWARTASGTGGDYGSAIAVDAAGNSYVAGSSDSPSLTIGSTILTNSGVNDIFVVKYNASGSVLWAKGAGGIGYDLPGGIAVDAAGNSYVTGYYTSPTIAIGSTALTNASPGSYDMYIAKYDGSGNAIWAKGAGGTGSELGVGIAADSAGNSYVTGYYYSSTITFGSTTLTNSGSPDVFVVKYDASGNPLWAKSGGGVSGDYGQAIAVDATGNSYVTGYSYGSITFGATTLTNAGNADIFVVKYDGSGNVIWAKAAGGASAETGSGIGVDAAGNSYVGGYFYSSPLTLGSISLWSIGSSDAFLVKIDGNPPVLISAQDVSGDQGGRVMLHWTPAAIDKVFPNTSKYSIWRALPGGQIPPASELAGNTNPSTSSSKYRQFSLNGTPFYWEWVADQPALLWPQYGYGAPTLSDSLSPPQTGKEYFVVVAETDNPNNFYVSNVDSGHSVDNLSPIPPAGMAAAVQAGPQVKLTWNSPTDLDVGSYAIYRSTASGFIPGSGNIVGTSGTTGFTDGSPPTGLLSYYRVIAVDIHGNKSLSSGEVSAALTVTQSFSMNPTWNMASVPLTVSNYTKLALFPTAVSAAFTYDHGYIGTASLENGRGYWVKYSTAQSVPMAGLLRTSDSVNVSAGWNMIGSLSSSIPIANVRSIPGGIVTSSFFGYNGSSYFIAANILPGQGYWIKVKQAGQLVLSSTGNAPSAARIRIEDTNEQPPSAPDGVGSVVPVVYGLEQNFPNPFNPTTTITYALPASGYVMLSVYNMLGQEVATLVNESQEPGYKSVSFDASRLSSGMYTYRITAGTFTDVKKMVLIR